MDSTDPHPDPQHCLKHYVGCPASPEKRRPSASSRTHSDGPVSQTLLTSTSKARAATRLRNPR